MNKLEEAIQQMRITRGWDKTDTPSILAKSICVEAAELLECFQFDEVNYNKENVLNETADVLMYAISLCMDLGVDYQDIIINKIKDVEERYPSV